MIYELDSLDSVLVEKLRDGIEQWKNGDPIRDFLDEDDLIQAAELLIAIIDAERKG